MDSGDSIGLTPFWIDFIDYVECDIDVKDSKLNKVVGFGTKLHKFTAIIGDPFCVPALFKNLLPADIYLLIVLKFFMNFMMIQITWMVA